MKNIKTLAVIGLLTGVGALQVLAAPPTPTNWVQTLNFSLTANTPTAKFTISSKDIINLLANDFVSQSNTNIVATNYLAHLPATNTGTAGSVLAATNVATSPLLFALSTNTPAFPTANVTVTNVVLSVDATTNLFTNTVSVLFTETASNVYTFANAVTLNGTNGGTTTAYLITNTFPFSTTFTNDYGTNTTLSVDGVAAHVTATYVQTNWLLSTTDTLSESVSNSVYLPTNIVTIVTTWYTNTFPAEIDPNKAKLVHVDPLTGTNNGSFQVVSANGKASVDVSKFFSSADAADPALYDFKDKTGKEEHLQVVTFSGHDGTSIVLEGLFTDTLGVTVKGNKYPDITKSFAADLTGYAHISGLASGKDGNALLAGKITSTGAAK